MPIAGRAEADARQLLETSWWMSSSNDFPLPVDPMAIARKLGLFVEYGYLPEDVSGTLVRQPGAAGAINLNMFDGQNRQRFTCAHEIGHYRKRVADGDAGFTFTDYRSILASAGVDADEIYANQFAAALLMPAHIVRQRNENGSSVASMAALLGTSEQAMGLRLRNLGLQR